MLTQNEFTEFKSDYPVYSKISHTDVYGNEQYSHSDTATSTLHVMWQPITDEAAIVEYGEKVHSMKQCVLYEDTDVEPFDMVVINDVPYTVVSVIPYNTYRLVRVEKQ